VTDLAQRLRRGPLARWFGRRRAAGHDATVGLVLSGGGARSSFQIGALRYLYERERIAPTVITGTSAGAILGGVLAQHPDPAGQRAALATLERLWRGMTGSEDMFTPYPWFARLRAHMPTWRKVLAMSQRSRSATTPAAGWHPGTAIEALGTLWEAGRSSADLQVIVRGPTEERAAFTPGPLVERLLDPSVFHPDRLAGSSVTLRIAVVGLESGELRYVTNSGAVHDREDGRLELDAVDVGEAIRASCAIPGVFPPVALDGEHYVDGGVRENLPVQIALDHLGVTHCYAVVASPSGVPVGRDYADADMFEIIMRSASGIMSDELMRDEIDWARTRGTTVIAPRIDVHDLVTIDPGLIAISIDHGFMRARDVVAGAPEKRQRLTERIVETRKRAWEAEEAAFANDGGDLDAVRALKTELRELLARVPAAELPEGGQDWWRAWEAHAFDIAHAPDWV
jgi:NTE family protein